MALFQTPFCSTFPQNGLSDPASQLGLHDLYHRRAQPPIGRASSTCTQVVWIFFWLLVLLVFAYPVALLAGLLYALLNPLNLIVCCQPLVQSLLQLLNLPQTCAQNMADAKQLIIM